MVVQGPVVSLAPWGVADSRDEGPGDFNGDIASLFTLAPDPESNGDCFHLRFS